MQNPPVHLIDASIYIFKAYFGLPARWQAEDGRPTECVFGFAKFLYDYLSKYQPKFLVCCFDESLGQGFREGLYPEYKASRALPDEDLAFQLESCKQLAELMGAVTVGSSRYEADDLIGSLAKQARDLGHPVVIASRDKDLGQLLSDDQIHLWDAGKIESREDIWQRFGVMAEQLADYLALVGDRVDDIPGVRGIGPKSAAAMLNEYNSIDQLYDNLASLPALPIRGAKGLADKLLEHRDQLMLMRQLTQIALDAPVPALENCRRHPVQSNLPNWLSVMGMPNHLIKSIQTLTYDK